MVDEPSLPISGFKKSQWEGNCDVSLLKTEVLSTWMLRRKGQLEADVSIF